MNNSQIAIMILAGNPNAYSKFITAIREGWGKEAIALGFKVYFYSGGHHEDVLVGHDEIRVMEDDSISNCYRKFVAAKNVLKMSFPDVRLIFRTNVSSYIDVINLQRYIELAKLSEDTLHGVQDFAYKYSEMFYGNKYIHFLLKILKIGPKIKFFSGAGLFMGINVAEKLSYDRKRKYLIDDVEIGRQITSFRPCRVNYPRILITESFNSLSVDKLDLMISEDLLFHYKFKTKDRESDAEMIKKFGDKVFRYSYLSRAADA